MHILLILVNYFSIVKMLFLLLGHVKEALTDNIPSLSSSSLPTYQPTSQKCCCLSILILSRTGRQWRDFRMGWCDVFAHCHQDPGSAVLDVPWSHQECTSDPGWGKGVDEFLCICQGEYWMEFVDVSEVVKSCLTCGCQRSVDFPF